MMNVGRSAIIALCGVACISEAQACDCGGRTRAKDAALAFVGVAEARTEWVRRESGDAYEMLNYTFTVERIVNGPNISTAVVTSDMTDCGMPFKLGRRYLVVANTMPDRGVQWFTTQCTETREVAK